MRDGNLESQIRKARKRYGQKAELICQEIREVFGPASEASPRGAGYLVSFRAGCGLSAEEILRRAGNAGIALRCRPVPGEEEREPEILLYLAAMETERYREALLSLRSALLSE